VSAETDPGCLFCRILSGEIASEQVAASETAYGFRDINPAAPSHVLVIPRRHVTDAAALTKRDGELLASLFSLANEVARSEGLTGGYRLVFNVGEDSGNSVPHLHLHVLGGRPMAWPPG
jgi:histidine triad (HIT) family protein